MPVRIVEGQLPYTGGDAISIDENKVISLNLRDENNLIIYDAQDDEIYVDLQLPDGIKPTDAFPIGVTTGRVLVADGWDKAGTIISAKTTSGDVIKLLYADDGTLWIDNGTGTFKQIYFKSDVDLIVQTIYNYINENLNTKTFFISGTAEEKKEKLGQAIQYYLNGKNPILSLGNTTYILRDVVVGDFELGTNDVYTFSSTIKSENGKFWEIVVDVLVTAQGHGSTVSSFTDTKHSAGAVVSATAPSNPAQGDLWYDTTNDEMKVYDGSQWNSIGTGGGTSSNTKTFTISSTSDLTNAQAALDWYLNGGNPILYHERGYTSVPMPCTYHLRETIYRNSNYEYVFVSPAGNWDMENLEWASESDTIFHCIGLSVADVNDKPGDTVLSIREFDIKGSDYFAKKADASKIEYVTQAEYNALLPGAASDGKHYFIYSTSGGGGWQPGVNTVAYYPLDTDFNDASGNSRNLTNSGGVITTLNDVNCAYYDGSSYSMFDNYSLSNTARTISCWVCKSNNARVALNVSNYNTTPAGSLGIVFYQSYVLVADNYGASAFSETSSAGVWYCITAVQEGNTVKGYLNGVYKGESTTRPDQTPTGWSLGAVHDTVHEDKYRGYISNVILENKARTAQEVSDYYNQTKGDYGIS